jgi:S1-C subfamily serine protease
MPTAAAWSCHRCQRRVPSHVDVCRCGSSRGAAPSAPGDELAGRNTAGLGPATWSLIVTAFVAAGGGLYLWQARTPTVPASAPLIADETPAAPAVPSSAPASLPAPVPAAASAPAPSTVAATPPVALPAAPAAAAVPAVSTRSGSIEDVVARSTAAVVMVETTNSRGTGFFVASDMLVTNDHVVGLHTSVTVKLHDGTAHPARVERTVPEVDLAVLRVSGASAPQVLTLRAANDVRPGQEVIAIGSALGLQSTVTRGIVSAKRLAGAVLLLQTDAAINPGNSGGPLLDRDGQVIGVTTLKMGSGAEGLGFAVAADHVRALLDGRPVTSAAPAASRRPLAASVPAMTNDTSADGQRMRGQEAYADNLGRLAQHAAQVDAQWTRFVATCQPAIARDGDRDWFSLAERPTTFNGRDRNCPNWLSDMQRMSREFAAVMRQTGEAARRAGVYPGTLRDVRRKHRLDWTGFER